MDNRSFADMQREAANAQFRADLERTHAAELSSRLSNAQTPSDVSNAIRSYDERRRSERFVWPWKR